MTLVYLTVVGATLLDVSLWTRSLVLIRIMLMQYYMATRRRTA